jgi:hypothetical protein
VQQKSRASKGSQEEDTGGRLSRFSVIRSAARPVIRAPGEFLYYRRKHVFRSFGTLPFNITALREEIVGYFLEEEGSAMHERFCGKETIWLPFAGLALLVGAFAVSCGGTAAEQGAEPRDGYEERASVELDHPTLGDENAPVVLSEYADYQ